MTKRQWHKGYNNGYYNPKYYHSGVQSPETIEEVDTNNLLSSKYVVSWVSEGYQGPGYYLMDGTAVNNLKKVGKLTQYHLVYNKDDVLELLSNEQYVDELLTPVLN